MQILLSQINGGAIWCQEGETTQRAILLLRRPLQTRQKGPSFLSLKNRLLQSSIATIAYFWTSLDETGEFCI